MPTYNDGRHRIAAIDTGSFRWLLVNASYTFDRAHSTVADVAGAEITASGYARVDLTSGIRTVDTDAHLTRFEAADPSFGALAAGQTVAGAILFEVGVDDPDSTVVYYTALTPTDTGALNPYTFQLPGGVVATLGDA